MKKSVIGFFVLVIIFMVAFVSAGWFGDLMAKIGGEQVSLSPNDVNSVCAIGVNTWDWNVENSKNTRDYCSAIKTGGWAVRCLNGTGISVVQTTAKENGKLGDERCKEVGEQIGKTGICLEVNRAGWIQNYCDNESITAGWAVRCLVGDNLQAIQTNPKKDGQSGDERCADLGAVCVEVHRAGWLHKYCDDKTITKGWAVRCVKGVDSAYADYTRADRASGDAVCNKSYLEAPQVICGDGKVEGEEECDDGNRINGDGCTSDCIEETTSEVSINSVCAIGVNAAGWESENSGNTRKLCAEETAGGWAVRCVNGVRLKTETDYLRAGESGNFRCENIYGGVCLEVYSSGWKQKYCYDTENTAGWGVLCLIGDGLTAHHLNNANGQSGDEKCDEIGAKCISVNDASWNHKYCDDEDITAGWAVRCIKGVDDAYPDSTRTNSKSGNAVCEGRTTTSTISAGANQVLVSSSYGDMLVEYFSGRDNSIASEIRASKTDDIYVFSKDTLFRTFDYLWLHNPGTAREFMTALLSEPVTLNEYRGNRLYNYLTGADRGNNPRNPGMASNVHLRWNAESRTYVFDKEYFVGVMSYLWGGDGNVRNQGMAKNIFSDIFGWTEYTTDDLGSGGESISGEIATPEGCELVGAPALESGNSVCRLTNRICTDAKFEGGCNGKAGFVGCKECVLCCPSPDPSCEWVGLNWLGNGNARCEIDGRVCKETINTGGACDTVLPWWRFGCKACVKCC